nr:MAG TPA: hypothetical protein [Bacteriophage sp.]DAU41001.1 MAG TPA: hypothetical protein [Bacteriophage sp.]
MANTPPLGWLCGKMGNRPKSQSRFLESLSAFVQTRHMVRTVSRRVTVA